MDTLCEDCGMPYESAQDAIDCKCQSVDSGPVVSDPVTTAHHPAKESRFRERFGITSSVEGLEK